MIVGVRSLDMDTQERSGTIAANVRAEIARQKLKQEDLGNRLHMSRSTFSRRFSGEIAWTAGEVAALAAELKVPIGDLFGSAATNGDT
jgi:transcriptional regulator with XRE-family HTH domain